MSDTPPIAATGQVRSVNENRDQQIDRILQIEKARKVLPWPFHFWHIKFTHPAGARSNFSQTDFVQIQEDCLTLRQSSQIVAPMQNKFEGLISQARLNLLQVW
jgi:hypothetical protein